MISPPPRSLKISRRRLLGQGALLGSALAFSVKSPAVWAAGPLKQVSLTLDWIYQGPNVGFMLAKDKGFYREAGLDVSLTPGKGSVSTAQLVASKATALRTLSLVAGVEAAPRMATSIPAITASPASPRCRGRKVPPQPIPKPRLTRD